MSRRVATVVLGIVAVLVVVIAGSRGAQADDSAAARDLLDRSRDAVSNLDFEGTVVVEWVDGGRRHAGSVSVQEHAGVLHIGGDRLVSAGTRRLLRTDAGWRLLWTGRSKSSEPNPSRKYRFVVTRSASVAHRPATQVAIARSGSRRVRERLFFDDATGMLLRRDQLDGRGRLVRRFAFVQMSEPRPVRHSETDGLPKVGQKAREGTPHALAQAPDDLRAPKRVGNGFALSGVYSQPDGSVQLYYSDGLLGLSMFESTGKLDWDALPAGGRTVELGGARAHVYATAAGSAVVWGKDDVTYTCVTDAPLDEITAIAAGFPGTDDSGVVGDVGRFVTAPFSWG